MRFRGVMGRMLKICIWILLECWLSLDGFAAAPPTEAVREPNRRIHIEAIMPSFARSGDIFEARVKLKNDSEETLALTLVCSCTGAELLSEGSSVQHLQPGESADVKRLFRAGNVGNAEFLFNAAGGGASNRCEVRIPILSYGYSGSVAIVGSAARSVEEHLVVPKEADTTTGEVELFVSSMQISELRPAARSILESSYTTLEQSSSKISVLCVLDSFYNDLSLPGFSREENGKNIRNFLKEVYSYEEQDGGYSRWPGTQLDDPYVSSFAALALLAAQEKGIEIEYDLMDTLLMRASRNALKQARESFNKSFCDRAIAFFVLARAHRKEAEQVSAMLPSYSTLPLFARAYILRTLVVLGRDRAEIDRYAAEVFNSIIYTPAAAYFEETAGVNFLLIPDSRARTTALVIRALLDAGVRHPLMGKAIEWLLAQRKNGIWRSTQENIFAIDAIAAYWLMEKGVYTPLAAQIIAGDSVIAASSGGDRAPSFLYIKNSISRLMPGGASAFRIVNDRADKIHFSIGMRYTMANRRIGQVSWIDLHRTLEPMEEDPEFKKSGVMTLGKRYKVCFTMSPSIKIASVVLEDPVPAGFEVDTGSLTVHFRQKAKEFIDPESYVDDPFARVEMFTDRIRVSGPCMRAGEHTFSFIVRAKTIGTFSYPEARIMCMYDPEVHATARMDKVEIR